MTVTRKTAAGCAIAALIVPLAATAAFAFPSVDAAAPRHAVSLVVGPQSYTGASAAQGPGTARAACPAGSECMPHCDFPGTVKWY